MAATSSSPPQAAGPSAARSLPRGLVTPGHLTDVLDIERTYGELSGLMKDSQLLSRITWKHLNENCLLYLKDQPGCKANKCATTDPSSRSLVFCEIDGVGSERQPSEAQSPDRAVDFVCSGRIKIAPDLAGRGRGYVAAADIPKGTLILAEKPYMGVLDVEIDRGFPEHWQESSESVDTDALACQFARLPGADGRDEPASGADLCDRFAAALHPHELSANAREKMTAPPAAAKKAAPARGAKDSGGESSEEEDASSDDAEICAQIEADIEGMMSKRYPDRESRHLLREKVRHNALGFYTNSEQFCYSMTFRIFQGTGCYLLASIFNHSCSPNVARYSVADATLFVTSRDVRQGEELCFSYIETDMLGEAKKYRDQQLDRDFACGCEKCRSEAPKGGDEGGGFDESLFLQVDSQLQAELSSMPSREAIAYIDSVLKGTHPEMAQGDAGVKVLGKDAQELRGTKIHALMRSGLFKLAARTARECIAWCQREVHVSDESLVVYFLIAGVAGCCSERSKTAKKRRVGGAAQEEDPSVASWHEDLRQALGVHREAFGWGPAWMKMRCACELEEVLRWVASSKKIAPAAVQEIGQDVEQVLYGGGE